MIISTNTSINWVSLACNIYSLSEHGDLSFYIVFFETVLGREHLGQDSKKGIDNLNFRGITLIHVVGFVMVKKAIAVESDN